LERLPELLKPGGIRLEYTMQIRKVMADDSGRCESLGNLLFGEQVGRKVGMAVADIGVGIGELGAQRTHAVHATYWVAENPSEPDLLGIVGLYSPRWIGSQNLYLGWFGVHPDHRRHGLGQALIKHAEAEAINLGCRSILVETSFEPASTISFYHRAGFNAVASVPDYWEEGSELILMRKFLVI